ncbi:MAG: nucleotide exchange factor GrpE [Anaerolineales bacterium]
MDSPPDETHPPESDGPEGPIESDPAGSPPDAAAEADMTEAAAGSEGGAPRDPAHESEADLETLESLRARLDDLRALADEYLDGWQRSRAEFANYKNRVKREEQEAHAQAAAAVLARALPLLDDLERALKDRPRQREAAVWADGIELIYRKWKAILESLGVEPIPAEGLKFDPTLHEALSHEDSPDHEEGEVIQVIVQGYRIGDRVLRPALVRVAK